MEPTPHRKAAAHGAAAAEERFQEACQQQGILSAHGRKTQQALSIQAAAVAAQQSAALSDEERLQQRERALQQQEQQLAGHFEEQRRLLLDQEERLCAEAQSLAQERSIFLRECDHLRRQLEQGKRELDERRQQLEAEDSEQSGHHDRVQRYWRKRWDAEWTRLRKEAAGHADQKHRLEEERRKFNGEAIMNRLRLEESWNRLRQEQQAWRDQRAQEESRLRERAERLEAQERALQEIVERLDGESRRQVEARANYRQELEGLETRIRHSRRKLDTLHQEAAQLEKKLCGPAPHPVVEAVGHLPGLVKGVSLAIPKQALDLLVTATQDLVDEQRRMTEQKSHLLQIGKSWRWEWDVVLASLGFREQELKERERKLAPREEALGITEQRVQRRAAELSRLEPELKAWEARLFRQQAAFRCERSRWLGILKARAAATRKRHGLIVAQRMQWEEERRAELERYRLALQTCQKERCDYLRITEVMRQKLAERDRRERALLEREMVLMQVEQELIAQDPKPVAAERELARRHKHWETLATKPLRALRRQQLELERRSAEHEELYALFLKRQEAVEEQKVVCSKLQSKLDAEQSNLTAERILWQHQLEAVRGERDGLRDHIRDLEQQLERLAVVLMEAHPPQPAPAAPALSLAA